MSRTCQFCGAAVEDATQKYCGHCGRQLIVSDTNSPTHSDSPETNEPPTNTSPNSVGEVAKSGVALLYTIVLCGVAIVVIGGGIWGLVTRRDKPAPHIPNKQQEEMRSISDFVLKVSEEPFQPGINKGASRILVIKYTGKEKLENVKIEVSYLSVSRDRTTEKYDFQEWVSGETQELKSGWQFGRSVTFSWSGQATINGKPVKLSGSDGSHQ